MVKLRGKSAAFWPLVSLLLLADCASKDMVVERLELEHVPHEVIGDVVRFTLAYNPGASFSMSFGEHSRWILSALAIGLVTGLLVQYRRAAASDVPLALALGAIVAGALGNLLDRLRRPRGVVDFIDIGVGDTRFWTFNVADVAIFGGAVLLAWLLYRRDRGENPAPGAPATTS